MVRYTKGEYKFQRKDTYWVGNLSKVILAYLEQLHKQLSQAKSYGVPIRYCELQAEVEGKKWNWEADIDLDAAHQIHLKELEELICIFNDKNEPNIDKYGFDLVFGDDTIKCTNQVERNRYHEDEKAWWERKQKGYKLFGEIYAHGLDW